jgi:sterol carrier protein 2
MGRKVFVVGVGMTKIREAFSKAWDYPDMAKEAGEKALADAGIRTPTIQQAAVGYCFGDSTCGQRAVYQLGCTGIPVYNVNNNCSTGSTALFMAKQFVEAASPTASSRSASRRWRRARSARSTWIAPIPWTSSSR